MLWKLKTYKTKYDENNLEVPTNAVNRRLTKLDRPIDLSLHRDRQLIGYNYLEYVK